MESLTYPNYAPSADTAPSPLPFDPVAESRCQGNGDGDEEKQSPPEISSAVATTASLKTYEVSVFTTV